MSEPSPGRDRSAGESEPARDDPFGRPMPDGGLAETMPDWLRRPPAWRETVARREKLRPPADTSPIDPRTLIDVEDLPLWLQRIAQRPTERAAEHLRGEFVERHPRRVVPVVDPHRDHRNLSPPEGQVPQPASAPQMRVVEPGSQRSAREDEQSASRGLDVAPARTGNVSEGSHTVQILVALLILAFLAIVGIAVLMAVV